MRKWIGIIALLLLLLPGMLALLHLTGAESKQPWVRYTIVVGASMRPTLSQGDGLLFARLPWHEGDIIMADVGERDPVIKRAGAAINGRVYIYGDNQEKSATYYVKPSQVMGKLMLRLWRVKGVSPPTPRRGARAGR